MARKKTNKAAKKAPSFLAVDFFCGAGGTTRGLIDAGGYVIAGIDNDARCERTYVSNNANATIDCLPPDFLNLDIFPAADDYPNGQQKILFTKLKKLILHYQGQVEDVPLLFAICAPCQPFTNLSKKGLTRERKKAHKRDRNLLSEAAKFVKRFRPDLILSENVAGIKKPRYGDVWNDFHKILESLRYVVGSKVVCTSEFGIPQNRKRSILIAVRKNLLREDHFDDLRSTELFVPDSDPNALSVSVRKAIGSLPPIKAGEAHKKIPNHRARWLSELNLRRLSCAKPGESNIYMENTKFGDLSLKCHRKLNKRLRARCFSDVYTRMHPDRPAPTITTKCHSISNGRFGHFDKKQVRGISLREAAILQSFPRNYIFYPEDQTSSVAQMIGNAVPPKLASFFAKYLKNSIHFD